MALPPPPMKLATVRTLLCLLSSLLPGLAAETGHPLRGVVTRVLAPEKLVLVQHEEIPGFMGAMTMAFRVPDAVWPQLTPGTRLTATLLAALRRTGKRYGVVSMCIGGGMGAAAVYENPDA